MKSFFKLLLACPLLLLAACKKEVNAGAGLSVSGFSAAAFATGDAITIYGSGFDPNPQNDVVLFNGTPGEVATATANRLQVIIPDLITDGKITVQVHGKSVESAQTYSLVNVLQGTYTANFICTPDKKYLLRGNVKFTGKLIIQAGTVIFGEKATHGGLTASDVDFEGTAANPVVFTSDQSPGSRAPGDWTGISTLSPYNPQLGGLQEPLGNLTYVRVEYAGYHQPGARGVAFNVASDPTSTCKYLEAAYSSGDGIDIGGAYDLLTAPAYMEHLVSVGCWGDDFRFIGQGEIVQYALGLKDPYNADPTISNGIETVNTNCLVSNFTLVGYNPSTRNIPGAVNALTSDAGAAIQFGGYNTGAGQNSGNDTYAMYNSVVVGGWLAGVSLYGAYISYSQFYNWNNYEDSVLPAGYAQAVDITLRNNFFVGTAPAEYPFRGGVFSRNGYESEYSGFDDVTATPQYAFFGQVNDTTEVLDFNQGRDDLGIKGLADYKQLTHPNLLPAAGSKLLTAAKFPAGTLAASLYLDKGITYAGAFGTTDWTASWCNFNPQQTQY